MLGFKFLYKFTNSIKRFCDHWCTVKFKTVKHPNSYRTELTQNWEYKNRTHIFCICEELEPNRTLTFVRTRTEPNHSSDGSFPSLNGTMPVTDKWLGIERCGVVDCVEYRRRNLESYNNSPKSWCSARSSIRKNFENCFLATQAN